MKIALYTQAGDKKGDIALNEQIFGQPLREGLLHEFVVMQQNNGRVDTATTLPKGEVRGGGRKPYRQKGTGHARQGSIRNPHYRGGGVAFGPRGNRNYVMLMPKKQRRAALFSALSAKAQEQEIMALEKFETKMPKTREFARMLEKLPVKSRLVVVIPEENLLLLKSARNIPQVRILNAQYLNVIDLLWANTVLFLEPALQKVEEIFLRS